MTNAPRQAAAGRLYIVATPIGNLEDISLRAVRILKEVDLIAAEDTRHTRKLLTHFGISTPLISYYREKEKEKGAMILARLEGGEDIALVSDAGTPGISDPGTMLVAKARERGLAVIPIPGPAAITAAVCASGFGEAGFLFCGFLPAKQGQRRKKLESMKNCEVPLVFYESPHRIIPMLKDAITVFGDRQSCIARELTKTYEEFRFGSLSELCRHFEQDKIRGEFVVIVAAVEKQPVDEQTVTEAILWYRDHGELSLKDAVRQIAADFGLARSVVYREALQLWKS